VAVKEHLDAETRASHFPEVCCSQGTSCCSIVVAYNVFSTVTYGEKTARLWFTEEATAGRTRSISPYSNKKCMYRTNERTPGIPLARLSGAECSLAMRRQ
jgi:hypothetical protein